MKEVTVDTLCQVTDASLLGGGNSNIFFIFIPTWRGRFSFWRSYFFKWVETGPPTRLLLIEKLSAPFGIHKRMHKTYKTYSFYQLPTSTAAKFHTPTGINIHGDCHTQVFVLVAQGFDVQCQKNSQICRFHMGKRRKILRMEGVLKESLVDCNNLWLLDVLVGGFALHGCEMKLNGAFTVPGTSARKHEQNRKGEPSYKNQKTTTWGKEHHLPIISICLVGGSQPLVFRVIWY